MIARRDIAAALPTCIPLYRTIPPMYPLRELFAGNSAVLTTLSQFQAHYPALTVSGPDPTLGNTLTLAAAGY